MSKVSKIDVADITVVTFATFGKSRNFRDYTERFKRMQQSCREEGVELICYTFEECAVPGKEFVSRMYPMRKGAGYWAWKPQVIKNAKGKTTTRYILYLDVDVQIQSLNNILVDDSFNESGVSLFETREDLSSWCSVRCLELFNIPKRNQFKIFSASVFLIDTFNSEASNFLDIWEQSLSDHRKLLDPLFTLKKNHRHDQSVLSCLLAKSWVKSSRFANGFYQTGVDNGTQTVESSWLIHGEANKSEVPREESLFRNFATISFHKYELFHYLVFAFIGRYFPLKKVNSRKGFNDNFN